MSTFVGNIIFIATFAFSAALVVFGLLMVTGVLRGHDTAGKVLTTIGGVLLAAAIVIWASTDFKGDKLLITTVGNWIRTILTEGLNLNPTKTQNWFRVYGKVPKEGLVMMESLQDFKQTTLGGETFYPLLVGQYEDAICYKMERISFWDLLAY